MWIQVNSRVLGSHYLEMEHSHIAVTNLHQVS